MIFDPLRPFSRCGSTTEQQWPFSVKQCGYRVPCISAGARPVVTLAPRATSVQKSSLGLRNGNEREWKHEDCAENHDCSVAARRHWRSDRGARAGPYDL